MPKGDPNRVFRDDLPTVGVSRLRASGAIGPDSTSVVIAFGDLKREVKVMHLRFRWNGGSWSLFLCPTCSRRVRTLRLHDGRVVCRNCDGLKLRCSVRSRDPETLSARIARLEKLLYGGTPTLHPRKSRRHAQNRQRLETSLRRALIVQRRRRLYGPQA